MFKEKIVYPYPGGDSLVLIERRISFRPGDNFINGRGENNLPVTPNPGICGRRYPRAGRAAEPAIKQASINLWT
jgi:hypothetical protein